MLLFFPFLPIALSLLNSFLIIFLSYCSIFFSIFLFYFSSFHYVFTKLLAVDIDMSVVSVARQDVRSVPLFECCFMLSSALCSIMKQADGEGPLIFKGPRSLAPAWGERQRETGHGAKMARRRSGPRSSRPPTQLQAVAQRGQSTPWGISARAFILPI